MGRRKVNPHAKPNKPRCRERGPGKDNLPNPHTHKELAIIRGDLEEHRASRIAFSKKYRRIAREKAVLEDHMLHAAQSKLKEDNILIPKISTTDMVSYLDTK